MQAITTLSIRPILNIVHAPIQWCKDHEHQIKDVQKKVMQVAIPILKILFGVFGAVGMYLGFQTFFSIGIVTALFWKDFADRALERLGLWWATDKTSMIAITILGSTTITPACISIAMGMLSVRFILNKCPTSTINEGSS